MSETHIPANREIVLGDVSGNTMELVVEIVPQKAREISTCVMRSPEAEEVYRRQILPTGSAAEKQRRTAVSAGCAGDRHFPLFPASRRTRTAARGGAVGTARWRTDETAHLRRSKRGPSVRQLQAMRSTAGLLFA